MNYYIYGYTDKGNYRAKNEDCMLINRETVAEGGFGSVCIAPFLTAVCDGVGGEQAGEIASDLCIRYLSVTDYDSTVDLDQRILQIHNKIVKHGIQQPGSVNMQTTLCCLAVDENGAATCYNIGDSRMYRYVNGCVRQISTDQTYGRFLYDNGAVERIGELDESMKNAIVSSVGSVIQLPKIEHIDFIPPFGRDEDDTVIICSDGFSDYVSNGEIESAMSLENATFKEKIDALCRLALCNGSTDNISVIGIKPWNTGEEYLRITSGSIAEGESPQVSEEKRHMQAVIAGREKFEDIENAEADINSRLAQAADDSLAQLFSDLENFRNS